VFTLAQAFIRNHKFDQAIDHLARAVALDPEYSAAWKSYGGALARAGRINDAIEAYTQGIKAAETRGDKQAQKEMSVFLKRLRKDIDDKT
jgi:tetratricopeptide (TPR) repeat protein